MSPDKIIMKSKEVIETKKKTIQKWPKVAIIVLNWNGWKDTIECLESVFRNTYPNYRVIVVDNGSTDGSMEKIKYWADGKQKVLTPEPTHPLYHLSHPPVKKSIPYICYTREEAEKGGNLKLEEKVTEKWQEQRKSNSKEIEPTSSYPLILIQTGENLGFAGGNNVGIRFASKQDADCYILLLNNDTVVEPGFIEELMKHYDKQTGISAPIIYNYYNISEIWSSGGEFNTFKGTYSNSIKKIKNNVKETNFITGCCWLIKNEIFKKLELINEKYFLYSEDVDFCYRLKRAGYKLKVIPSSVIFHKIKETIGDISPFKLYYFHRSKLMLINTNYKGFKKIYYKYLNIIFRYIRAFEYFIRGRNDISKSIWRALKDYNK